MDNRRKRELWRERYELPPIALFNVWRCECGGWKWKNCSVFHILIKAVIPYNLSSLVVVRELSY